MSDGHGTSGCCGSGCGKPEGSGLHKDPVCGMMVDAKNAAASWVYEGTTYYFCNPGCAKKFQGDPKKYLTRLADGGRHGGHGQRKSESIGASAYTCPMHPEVRSHKPGSCPKCGMALESMLPAAGEDDSHELRATQSRLFWSALFAIPLFAVAMLPMGMLNHIQPMMVAWLQLALASPVVLWAAAPLFAKAWQSLANRSPNMFTLLALGIAVPYFYSLVALVAATASGSAPTLYFESAAVITALAWLGQYLEARARSSSRSAIKDLVTLMPAQATLLLADGSEKRVPVGEIKAGDKVRVKPGERFGIDGKVVSGASSVDESMLSGEALPVYKQAGSVVAAGTVNGNGSLDVVAAKVGSDTMLAQIIGLVSQAQRSRVPAQQLADKVSAVFVPAVVAVSLGSFLFWMFVGGSSVTALYYAIAVLVVACPCALGLATPMSIIVASGRAAREGILFKEARWLEALGKVDTIVIDKTGTLTVGKPKLVSTSVTGILNENDLLALAAAVEAKSEHPLAAAITSAAAERNLSVLTCDTFDSKPGLGVIGSVAGRQVAVGTAQFMGSLNIVVDNAKPLSEVSTTTTFIAVDGQCAGLLEFSDELRPGARAAVMALQTRGIRVVLASGDNEKAAQVVAKQAGIAEVHAALLPADKAALVKKLKSKGAVVAMIGDGVNDAPALAQADVGIAMGTGTDVAANAAGIVLVRGDLAGVVRALKLSKAMTINIIDNLILAFAYNLIAVPVAAGLLSPLGVAIDPMFAALAMSLSSAAVIVNALRLRRLKL